MSGSIASITEGLNARAIARRSVVCSGGSVETSTPAPISP